jgi:hypothetical protein
MFDSVVDFVLSVVAVVAVAAAVFAVIRLALKWLSEQTKRFLIEAKRGLVSAGATLLVSYKEPEEYSGTGREHEEKPGRRAIRIGLRSGGVGLLVRVTGPEPGQERSKSEVGA